LATGYSKYLLLHLNRLLGENTLFYPLIDSLGLGYPKKSR
jgi:hypothetical protein